MCAHVALFFFQAEDGIRDHCVTGVQTCALPIFVEADALELDDGLRDVGRPVLAAGLDHADGKAMERDVEDVPTLALEPRRHAAEVVVVLHQQDCIAAGCQPVSGGQAGKPRAEDDHVILGLDVSEPVLRHYFFRTCRLAIEMPLSIAPTIPRNPWSFPQMNKFSRCVRPVLILPGMPYTAPFRWPVHCLMVRGVKKSVTTMRSRKSGPNCSTSLWILGSHSALAATYSASWSPLQPSKLARQVMRIMLLGRGLS